MNEKGELRLPDYSEKVINPGLAKCRIREFEAEEAQKISECGPTKSTRARKLQLKLTEEQPKLYECKGWLRNGAQNFGKVPNLSSKSTRTGRF